MKVGIPKEIKNNEYRVAMTPAGVVEMRKHGHVVWVEANAGIGAGYSDEAYEKVGAKIAAKAKDVYDECDMIVKVKEPLSSEYSLVKDDQIIFTYFHFASSLELTEAMLKSRSVCIAYETIQAENKSLPLLTPMSMVAGRVAIQEGAKYLLKMNGGKGKLIGGVPGVAPANVLVLGGGIVGTEAAKMAAGMGANVTVFDINSERLIYLNEVLPKNVTTLYSNQYTIEEAVATADIIVGAVLIPGGKAPLLVTRAMLSRMEKGTVLMDIAVDQGGCMETCRPTTHTEPTYVEEGIIHYGVANMPGAVPQTATRALTNATLPYILQIANKGWVHATNESTALKKGLNVVRGIIEHPEVKAWYESQAVD